MTAPLARRDVCAHLRPLEEAIAAAKVTFAPTASPYGGDATWWMCGCTFDEPSLRRRLRLDPCVRYVEYDGRAGGADATFTCAEDDVVFIGPHPSWAAAGTPHLR